MQKPSNLALLLILATCLKLAAEDGLAAKYPGDVKIETDPDVVLVERFDAPLKEILKRWESVQNKEIMTLSADAPKASQDGKSLLMTHRGGDGNGAHLYRRLKQGHEKLYVRFYVKFDRDCYPIHHFFHVGGYNPATAWPQGGAGQRPRGNKRFTVGVEPHGKAWVWDYYAYWMEMGGSPPRGQTWGNSFVRDPDLKVVRDQWMCLELMIKMNDVDDSNGEMALWVDGKNVSRLGKGYPKGMWFFDKFTPNKGGEGVRWSDKKNGPVYLTYPSGGKPFQGFRWRTDERLNINFVWVLLYITKAPQGHQSKVWFDNIVVAKKYIGPISQPRN